MGMGMGLGMGMDGWDGIWRVEGVAGYYAIQYPQRMFHKISE